MKTYMVVFMDNSSTNDIHFGNFIFSTDSTGTLLYQDARNIAESRYPGSVIINICKLD